MHNIKDLLAREPALVIGLVVTFLGMCSAFGFAITQEQIAAIVAFVGSLLALSGFLAARGRVSPHRPAKDEPYRGHGQRRD